MTAVFMKRLDDGRIKIYAAIRALSGRELHSIERHILCTPYIRINADNYECAVQRTYGCESYFRVSVHLDAHTSNEAQLCALLLFCKAIIPFFRITKICVYDLVQDETAYA